MRKFLYFSAALLAALLSSCNKEPGFTPAPGEKEYVTLSVNVGAETKAGSTTQTQDNTVNSVQVFIFDASGAFETKASGTATSLDIKCVTGAKKIVALVNAPVATPASYSALMSTVSNLSDNALSSFVMVGEASKTVTASDNTVTISVKRLVAKVSINKITNAMTGINATKAFVVKKVYLINVAANTTYALGAPTDWLNKIKWATSSSDALLYDTVASGTVANGSSYSTVHSFFPYPNPTTSDNQNSTWSARHTRLVVEATLGGEAVYYPITLPVLERNKTYTITELTIKVPGSEDPDKPVEKEAASFTISVSDWENGSNISQEI